MSEEGIKQLTRNLEYYNESVERAKINLEQAKKAIEHYTKELIEYSQKVKDTQNDILILEQYKILKPDMFGTSFARAPDKKEEK